MLSGNSAPGLLIDVRLPGGGKTITNVSPGQVIALEVWATVTGSNSAGEDDFLKSFSGSFLSSNVGGGAVLGSLQASVLAPFNARGSTGGKPMDLDGDGDLDIGSDEIGHPTLFAVRSGFDDVPAGVVTGSSQSFKVATLTFTVEQLLPGRETQINFDPSLLHQTALWLEDTGTQPLSKSVRQAEYGIFHTGTPVVIFNAAEPGPFTPTLPNTAPFFAVNQMLTVFNDAGPQVIPNWASHISPGNADESAQKVTFLVVAREPSLFAVQPAISPDGTLTFTPAPGAAGQCQLVILLQDDGGTANGGADTSFYQYSLITIDRSPNQPEDPGIPTLPPEPPGPPAPVDPPANQPDDSTPPTGTLTDPVGDPSTPPSNDPTTSDDPSTPDDPTTPSMNEDPAGDPTPPTDTSTDPTTPDVPSTPDAPTPPVNEDPAGDPTSPPATLPDPTPPDIITLPIDDIGEPIVIDPPFIIDPIYPPFIIDPIYPPFIIDPIYPPIIFVPPPIIAVPTVPNTPPIGPGIPGPADDSPLIELRPKRARRKPKGQSLDIPAAPQSKTRSIFNIGKPIAPQTPSDSGAFLTKLRNPAPRSSAGPTHPLLARLHRS